MINQIHPTNIEIIKSGYDKMFKAELLPSYWGELQNKIDGMGYISKATICDLIGEDPEDEDDFWIMLLEDWDYEVHFGDEKFRPTSIRGKVEPELNEQWIKIKL